MSSAFESPIRSALLDYTPPQQLDYINILVIGEIGSGKSSLISTFHRALHPEAWQKGAASLPLPIASVSANLASSHTLAYNYYQLVEGINIFDTRGLEMSADARKQLEQVRAMRDGKARPGTIIRQKDRSEYTLLERIVTLMNVRSSESILSPDCVLESALDEPVAASAVAASVAAEIEDLDEQEQLLRLLQRLPHAIIIVLPANQRHIPSELDQYISVFTDLYKPLVCISKIDCHSGDKNDVFAATQLYDEKKRQVLDRYPTIEYDQVKPMQNYTNWLGKGAKQDNSIDNLALDLLKKAVAHAEQFINENATEGAKSPLFLSTGVHRGRGSWLKRYIPKLFRGYSFADISAAAGAPVDTLEHEGTELTPPSTAAESGSGEQSDDDDELYEDNTGISKYCTVM